MAGNKRSPAAPSSSLEYAIERVKRLHQSNHDHWMPLEAAAQAWKFSPKSSGFLQAIATLIQFGLLLEKGSKDTREVKLSDIALDVVTYPEGTKEWVAAVQKAALAPAIYNELWIRFERRLPPEDTLLRVYLLRQREAGTFRQEQADETIRLFRDTPEFAGLTESAMMDSETDEEESSDSSTESTSTSMSSSSATSSMAVSTGSSPPMFSPSALVKQPQGTKQDVYSLDHGEVVIRWPDRIKGASKEDIENWLKLIESKLKRAVDDAQEKSDQNQDNRTG